MVLKIRSLAFMLLLMMALPGNAISTPPVVYHEGQQNLIIGGILQNSPNPDQNDIRYETFANENHATYVPTYYSLGHDGNELQATIDDSVEVNKAAHGEATDLNGLTSPALQNHQYDTIISYSGGTATAVAALKNQKVTCDTLILISPMKGALFDADYEHNIEQILTSGSVNHIVVIWSPEDKPTWAAPYEAQISSDWDSMGRITVYRVDLPQDKNNGLQAHKDIFFDYAMNNIKNGEHVVPAAVAGSSIGKPVTLTLYVRDGAIDGPLLSGVQVTGHDAAGNSFSGITDSTNPMKIIGSPGPWDFTFVKEGYKISKEGYQTNDLDFTVTENMDGTVYLNKTTPANVAISGASMGKPVTLDLYIHNGNTNGPVISGAQITGQDGSGNTFQATTGDLGHVTITENPGTWSFTVSAPGFETNVYRQDITDACTRHAFLLAVQPQQSVAPATPSSENNPQTPEDLEAKCLRVGGSNVQGGGVVPFLYWIKGGCWRTISSQSRW